MALLNSGPIHVSTWTSVLSGFSVQYCLWLVSGVRVLSPVSLSHCGSSLFQQGRTPFAVHSYPGSLFSWRVSFSPCHFCTVGYLPAGGSRLPSGSSISPGPFLLLLAALRGQIPDPTPLPRFSDRHHCGVFPGISWCSFMDCLIPGLGSVSVASLQAVVWSKSDSMDFNRKVLRKFQGPWNLWKNFDMLLKNVLNEKIFKTK
jgi:hypothetical protein